MAFELTQKRWRCPENPASPEWQDGIEDMEYLGDERVYGSDSDSEILFAFL
jgi:hypothetical protein